jgi:hypothetical protein
MRLFRAHGEPSPAPVDAAAASIDVDVLPDADDATAPDERAGGN